MEYGHGDVKDNKNLSKVSNVLILLLMEYGHGERLQALLPFPASVLILLLMEYGHGESGRWVWGLS